MIVYYILYIIEHINILILESFIQNKTWNQSIDNEKYYIGLQSTNNETMKTPYLSYVT